MVKQLKIVAAVVSITLVIMLLCGIGKRVLRSSPSPELRREDGCLQETNGTVFAGLGFTATVRPQVMPITDLEKAELKVIYDRLAEAYSNSQHEVIAEWEDKLPSRIASLTDKDLMSVDKTFFRMLFDAFMGKGVPLRSFSDVGEFESRVRTDFEASKLYFRSCLARNRLDQFGVALEARVLNRLNEYKKHFASEGNGDFVKRADCFIAEWIDQIESQHGFSRWATLFWMSNWSAFRNDAQGREQTWESLRDKAIMQGAGDLIKIGYNPKWADELRTVPDPMLQSETIEEL